MSGRALLEKMRERGFNRQTPVFVAIFADRPEHGIGFRVNDILAKPLSERELLDALERSGLSPGNAQPILLVDDDQPALQLAGNLLRQAGYRTICARDAASALMTAGSEQPAAIILDPVSTEFLKEFRKSGNGRATPVIICTSDEIRGSAPEQIRAEPSSMGCDDACGSGLIDELAHVLSNSGVKSQPLSADASLSIPREVTHGSTIHIDRR
jgi:CheY-like chemotaxis protein